MADVLTGNFDFEIGFFEEYIKFSKANSKSIVNLGNDKLNINTSTAKGLEKAIGVISRFIINAQGKTTGLLYGKFQLDSTSGNPVQRVIDKGIINAFTDIADVDYCNIINWAINQVPGGTVFDPTKEPPRTASRFEKAKYAIQKGAFEVQSYIDKYYAEYGNLNNPSSRAGLSGLLSQLSLAISELASPDTGINNPELLKAFPELTVVNNYFGNVSGFLNKYSDVRNIPVEDVQKILSYIDKTRYYAIAIQGLNTPASYVNFLDEILGGDVQKQIAKITKLIPLDQFARLIQTITKKAADVNTVGQKAIGYVNTGRSIIKILVLLLKIFKIITKFLNTIPIPEMFNFIGGQNLISDYAAYKINKFVEKTVNRLNQINAVLNLMIIFLTTLVGGIAQIIDRLTVIYLNLQQCTNVNKDLLADMENTLRSLSGTANSIRGFLEGYNNSKSQAEKKFGIYTIEIVNEEVVDEGITLRRRFGIARDLNGYVAVQSTPTFASLDLIIINEVKVLLVSKGLVNADLQSLSSDEILTLLESLRFLGNEDIDISDIQLSNADLNLLKEQNDEIGLQTFVDNLAGGKALRKKVRQAMQKSASKLKSDLSNVDPNNKYSTGII